MIGGIRFINPVGGQDTEKERYQNPGMTDHQRFINLIFQHTEIQFHADNEHKKDQSDLAQQFKIGQRVDREQKVKSFREKKSQDRRPQDNAGYDFPNHPRLSDETKQIAEKTYH